jgi:hypothetical protein
MARFGLGERGNVGYSLGRKEAKNGGRRFDCEIRGFDVGWLWTSVLQVLARATGTRGESERVREWERRQKRHRRCIVTCSALRRPCTVSLAVITTHQSLSNHVQSRRTSSDSAASRVAQKCHLKALLKAFLGQREASRVAVRRSTLRLLPNY